MVMTEHAAPRLSVRGLTLALTLAVGGCIVTPLWACPPSEKLAEQKQAYAKLTLDKLPTDKAPPMTDARDDDATYEKFPQSRRGRTAEQRIEQIKHQIKQLEKELAKIHKGPGSDDRNPLHPTQRTLRQDASQSQSHNDSRTRHSFTTPSVPIAPRPPQPPRPPIAPNAPGIALVPQAQIIDGQRPAVVIAQGGPGRIAFAPLQSAGNKVSTRKYKLSQSILKDLTELMVRPDVPIIVSPHEDYIEVQANQAQHMIFSAFTKMIAGDKEQKREYKLSEGKLEALTKLMSRNDVPIIIEPGDAAIAVHGNALEQAVFGAFVEMINQPMKVSAANSDSPFAVANAQEGDWAAIAEKLQKQASKAFRENGGNWRDAAKRYQQDAEKAYSTQMKKWTDAAKIYELEAGKIDQGDLKKILKSLEGQITLSTEQATRMALEAMKVAEMAEMLEAEAQTLSEESLQENDDDSKGSMSKRKTIERMIKKLMQQIKALKAEVQAIEDEADVIEDEAELLREQADQVEDAIAVIEEVEETVASNGR